MEKRDCYLYKQGKMLEITVLDRIKKKIPVDSGTIEPAIVGIGFGNCVFVIVYCFIVFLKSDINYIVVIV